MRVLVTGSNGFIGTAVQKSLASSGHELISYDMPTYDVRDVSMLTLVASTRKAEAIINLAGMLGTPELFGHEAKAAETNIIGAINVYDVAARLDIPVVQIGTGHKGQPNPYAITKACAEDLGLARAQWRQEKIAVVRAYHVYGPRQPVGPPHGTASVHKFFPTFATRALTNMPLELCGGGNQVIDPVYVDDVADVLADSVQGPYGIVIEAGTGVGIEVGVVATDIAAASGASSPVLTGVTSRDGEPRSAVVIAKDAPACHNLWPYMVTETVDWYRQWLIDHL